MLPGQTAANLGLAILLVTLCWLSSDAGIEHRAEQTAYFLGTAVLAINSLRRPPAAECDKRWWVCLICSFSLVYFVAFETNQSVHALGSAFWGIAILHGFGDLCLISLGTSFAILPASRGIRTRFLYRIVRHPVYTLYMVADIIFVSVTPSFRNLAIAFLGGTAFVIRAELEERLLRKRTDYREYARRIPYRFLPGVY